MNIALGSHPDCAGVTACTDLAERVHAQLATGRYDWPASILELTDHDAYRAEHRTTRKRAAHAERLGYRTNLIERADHVDEIYRINTSTPERQGRPMSDGYKIRPEFTPLPEYECARHRIDQWGVFHGRTLAGYLVLYVCGELAMVSQLLGHADRLRDDVMYLLTVDAFANLPLPISVFYNRWDSGQDGLRFFKERLGFAPERVSWQI